MHAFPSPVRLLEGGNLFCLDCGARISADSKFCQECGAKVGASVRTVSLTAADLEPVEGEVNQDRLTKLLDMAFWHNDVGNLDSAILACEAALTINPSSTTAHSLLATVFEKKGDDDRAIQHLEAVLTLNPESTADLTKLDQLRRGVRVKAIQPPRAYRWVPPALANVTMAGVSERLGLPARMRAPANPRVVAFACAAAVAVLLLWGGLMVVRPSTRTVASANVRQNPVFASRPMVNGSLLPPPGSPVTAPPAFNAPTRVAAAPRDPKKKGPAIEGTPDVFGGVTGSEPVFPVGPAAQPAFPVPTGPAGAQLPPLKAIPLDANPIAPAPVTIGGQPNTNTTPLVTTDNIPRHTVVVSNLGPDPSQSGQPQASPYAAASNAPGPSSAGTPEPSGDGDVHVTVHGGGAPSVATADLNRGVRPMAAASVNVDEAQAYQQYALSLQQQGDYRGAKSAYERAVRLYKARIQSGHGGDDTQRGLRACQTGLEICQQSLQ